MLTHFTAINSVDDHGNPTGGFAHGVGMTIDWQNGPLGRGDERREPNGAFVETVIAAAMQRLDFYQTASAGRFACAENQQAINLLAAALAILDARTKDREARGVEGVHRP